MVQNNNLNLCMCLINNDYFVDEKQISKVGIKAFWQVQKKENKIS